MTINLLPTTLRIDMTPPSPNLLLLIVSSVLAVFGFVFLDWAYSRMTVTEPTDLPGCTVQHLLKHHALEPNCQGWGAWGERKIPIATNSLALIDKETRDVPKRSERPRILLLGDSFTAGAGMFWDQSFVGQLSKSMPDVEILNGGMGSYSPTNYLNVASDLLERNITFDEVIVFVDISDIQDEAAYYREINSELMGPAHIHQPLSRYFLMKRRLRRLRLTTTILELAERMAVSLGFYKLPDWFGDIFDMPRSAWTYRAVNNHFPFPAGYAPLGVEAGIARATSKMESLYELLKAKGISVSVAVYPWPAQLVHDDVDSRHVRIW